ncbi:hypothetical protein QN362_17670 [Actimicrobium sp. CCC2.4]|uniref:hypothetical protein n=1 Tax=Actimicrobium sp. CCC2.4 TaxID=3048606 RepID=UPI002AC902A3|nr:hypothetical protein [Actimicrobium sp. CCC2.4]MEB0137164.1 hypothetical protein [Actimicrobium sp. CCC2.4]WPX30903.1 hypothetical protein RHM62_11580 [Actimicrobium sp. CCC2.4]
MENEKIELMADYGCFPLWSVGSDEVGDINPNDLPLSPELKQLLANWTRTFDQTLNQNYPPDSGFKSEMEEIEFSQQALELAKQLRKELGAEYEVIFQI